MPKDDDLSDLREKVGSIEGTLSVISKLLETKDTRDQKYFEALFSNIKEVKETNTTVLIRQAGMDERASAHYKADELAFKNLTDVSNDVEDLKKDKWKVQGIASFVALVVGTLSALGITLTFHK